VVGKRAVLGDVGHAAPHEALDGNDGVGRIVGLRRARAIAHLDAAVRKVAHDRGQERAAFLVGDDFGQAAPHGRGERVRSAQVDAHRELSLVRRGRFARLGDLQEGH